MELRYRIVRSLLFLAIVIAPFCVAADREIQAKHLTLVLKQSAETAAPGGQVSLIADVTLPPGMHVYAPGIAAPYKPIRLEIKSNPDVKLGKIIYPPSKTLHLKAIDETVPVFEGTFRLQQVVTLIAGAKTVQVEGSLNYQTCDDKICFLPVSIPVNWTVEAKPANSKRR